MVAKIIAESRDRTRPGSRSRANLATRTPVDPLDRHLPAILDRVESRLAASPINDPALTPQIFLLNSPSR